MFSLAQPMGWDCYIVGTSLAKVTMATIAYCRIVLLWASQSLSCCLTTVKSLFIVSEGTVKNKRMWETIVVRKVCVWTMYRDQRRWTILAWKRCMQEWWIEVSLLSPPSHVLFVTDKIPCLVFCALVTFQTCPNMCVTGKFRSPCPVVCDRQVPQYLSCCLWQASFHICPVICDSWAPIRVLLSVIGDFPCLSCSLWLVSLCFLFCYTWQVISYALCLCIAGRQHQEEGPQQGRWVVCDTLWMSPSF
jgi:hypothetical protein